MISLNQLSMRYGDNILFESVSFQFNSARRYGVVGANGAGKSTLLKIMSGEEPPFSGSVTKPQQVSIGVLNQDHYRFEEQIISDIVLQGHSVLWKCLQEKEELLSKGEFSEADGIELSHIEERIGAVDGYAADSEVATILDGLGIKNEFHREPLRVLSGGYKLRVLLARLLFSKPDVLLLDEPTNHLDIYSIRWLEGYLKKFTGTAIIVSHDHHFLNSVCTDIADIDFRTIKVYSGNYDRYLKAKALAAEQQEKSAAQQERKIDELQSFVDRFRVKATKAKQAQARLKQLDKMEKVTIEKTTRRAPHFRFPICRPSGVTPLTVDNVCKSFDGIKVLDKVSFSVDRGDKLAIIGPNGIGKSTLLKILTGTLAADKGSFEWGYETHQAYFPQDHKSEFPVDRTLFDWLSDVDGSKTIGQVRAMLGRVLFSGDDAGKKLSVLSGGECARLILAKLMTVKQNVLIFDEPTNHLDLETVEELARVLREYEGTLLLVSHNRFLVSKVADRVLEIKADGIKDFKGGYEEFLEKFENDDHLTREVNLRQRSATKNTPTKAAGKNSYEEGKEYRRQLKKLEKRNGELEARIENLEQRQSTNAELLFDYQKFSALSVDEQKAAMKEKTELIRKLEKAVGEWEIVSTQLEQLSESL